MRVAVVCGNFQIFNYFMQDFIHTFKHESVTKYGGTSKWVVDSTSFTLVNSKHSVQGRPFNRYIVGHGALSLTDYEYIIDYLKASGAEEWEF